MSKGRIAPASITSSVGAPFPGAAGFCSDQRLPDPDRDVDPPVTITRMPSFGSEFLQTSPRSGSNGRRFGSPLVRACSF